MSRKSYKELQRDLLECQQAIATLATDPRYNATRRAAVPFALRHLTATPTHVVLVSLLAPSDPQHVKRALHTRHAGSLMVAHWEGDEFLIMLSGDPQEFTRRLYPVARNEGLELVTAHVHYTGDIEHDVRNAQAIAQAHKEGYSI